MSFDPRQIAFAAPIASLWLRPWFDRLALRSITRQYMPLSRAWAAAVVAEGDLDRFWQELPGVGRNTARLRRAVGLVARRDRAYRAADAAWQAAFFSDNGDDFTMLPATIENARRKAALDLTESRTAFIGAGAHPPAIKWNIQTPAAVMAAHGHRLASTAAAFPPPAAITVRCSNRIRADNIEQYWLRFMSPVAKAGETWARVYEPRTAEQVPTLIFLHGIGMEWEFWPKSADPMPAIAARGIRVIRTEGPWHGRRQARGWFSGEPTIANGPIGFIDLFAAWVAESAALIEWARKNFPGKVALGGVSLGALSAQLVATAAANWRPSQIPDGLLLITTTRDFEAICLDSGFAHALGAPDRLAANGWRREDLQACLPILAPQGEPAISPERIVVLLGDADNVTPIAGGRDLVRDWHLPPANVFLRHRGHFSAGLGALAETAALDRLWDVLRVAA